MPTKRHQVIKATTRDIPGVTVGGRPKMFAPNGAFETSDAGEAAEIDKVLGAKGTGEVVVTSYDEKEPGHNYTFRGVDTSHIKATRDNGYVWVRKNGREIRIKREIAVAEGYHIPTRKRNKRRRVKRGGTHDQEI
jgi:hypothetical protein